MKKATSTLIKSMLLTMSSLPIGDAMANDGLSISKVSNQSLENVMSEIKLDIKNELSKKENVELMLKSVGSLLSVAKDDDKLKAKIEEELMKQGYSVSDSTFRYQNDGINLSGWWSYQGNYYCHCHSACHGACHGSRGWR